MVVVRSIAAGLAGAYLFERLRVPAGALIGAMLAAAALNLSGLGTAESPEWLRFGSYAVIGWILGTQFTRDTVETLRGAILPIAVVVVSLLAAAALITVALRVMGLDVATAFLAASPGGISQMAAISAEVGANGALVATAHLVRVIVVVLTAPLVAKVIT